jgi:F0F1-type ATP synthase membrane subunit b/b'
MNDKSVNENIGKVFKQVDNLLKQNVSTSKKQILRQYKIALEDIRKELRFIYDNYAEEIITKRFTVDKLNSLVKQISESIVKLKIEDAELTKAQLKECFPKHII